MSSSFLTLTTGFTDKYPCSRHLYVYEFKSDGSGNYMVKGEKGTDVIPIHYVITEASNGKYTYLLQIVYDRKNGIEEGHQSWMNIDSDRMFLYDVLPDSESSGIIYECPLTPIVLKRQGI